MKNKKFDAVKMKRQLQKEAELKLANLSEKEQFELLHKKFGHLIKQKVKIHFAQKGLIVSPII
jgi:hypothetical protein